MESLSNSEEVIRRIYQITNDYSKGFEYQMHALLQMGLERFGLDIGILSQIEQDRYTIEYCVTPKEIALTSGDEFDLGNTYCQVTYSANAPVVCEYVGKDDRFNSHPAYESFGLESYIGIPIKLNDKIFGTLNFSSHNPFPRKFNEIDIDALQLMASWISVELMRRKQETQLQALNSKLELLAYNDSLTNIPNRRAIFKHLKKEFNLMFRLKARGVIAIIDIDYFKKVNDRYGHKKGDDVLFAVAENISNSIRDYDFLARLGGEEFLLWLPHTDNKGSDVVCKEIMQNINKITLTKEPLTLSIGVCQFHFKDKAPKDITTVVDTLIARADEALYQAKAAGRNRIMNYETAIQ